MRAILELELVGDNVNQLCKLYSGICDELIPGLGEATFGKCPPSAWCAEITGTDPKFKYSRGFLRYKKDYSRSNSKGSRGVYAVYCLESDKIYEAKYFRARYFCIVSDWKVERVEEEYVQQWLKDRSASTCLPPQSSG